MDDFCKCKKCGFEAPTFPFDTSKIGKLPINRDWICPVCGEIYYPTPENKARKLPPKPL